jgi:xylan 1,4-beta-xylosidase
MKKLLGLLTLCIVTGSLSAQRLINADYKQVKGSSDKGYELCIGAGRASEGLRADWQQQLAIVQKEMPFKYMRFHGLLNDDMYVYSIDKLGAEHFNFQYVDKLYDYLLSINIKPFVELGFMPPALASGEKTVFWWKGNVTPPKSYDKWTELITKLMKHWEERYGRDEVKTWYFEVWNEPDLKGFFTGDQNEYFKLYSTTVKAIKAVSADYRVGGPATSGCKWIGDFIKYCSSNKVPVDFVSTHSYNTKSVLDEFGTGRRRLLAKDYLYNNVQMVRRIIDSSVYKGMELHFTEFNSSPSSRDPIHDTYQNAAYILNTLKNTEGAANSMSYWTFTDIFEEASPAVTAFHGGFGLLNLQGIRKPTYYAYKYLHDLGDTELRNIDQSSWICKDKNGLQVLLWDLQLPKADTVYDEVYFKNNIPAQTRGTVKLNIKNVPPGRYKIEVYQTGYEKNDPLTAYRNMGSPANLNRQQEQELKALSGGKPASSGIVNISGSFTKEIAIKENDIFFLRLTKL